MLSTIVLGRRRSVLPISLRKGRKRKSIEDLPTELLIQIFLDCLSLKEFPRPWIREAPVLLTRVCQRWRSIALSSAQLWAAITLKRTRGRREEQDVMALDVWIQRSGSCPLSVYLRHGGDYYCTGKSVQTILPHVSRWKAVYLTASKHCILIMRSGGNLEGLRVDGHINGAEGVIEVLQGAHSLKSLSVGNSGSILTHMSILKPLLDISYVLCPQLDSFEFLGDWSHMDIRRVADILVYRWRHSRSYDERHSSPSMVMFELKECVYTFRHNIYISKCVDEGMRVAQLDCSQSWWLSRV
ncbi:hypothetical protein BD410DRAFT_355712 [Rickenella mellea]|uniref:F-box domain-containing protein n=1 Tax=Rickenella mellea TaxID=50990 RepID=A0A4Y7Q1U0_9AGAM|nr:hypothetical protein BD410DRAFT_355712 [Rickenella mellea]